MPPGRHIYAKEYEMAKATICTYPQSDHSLPLWKCVLWCCSKFPGINLSDQESYNQYSETTTSIWFHIYHIIGHFTDHGIFTFKDNKYVTCVNKNLHQITLQKYTPEKSQ